MHPDAATISIRPPDAPPQASPRRAITVFMCANCARPARAATSAGFPRPDVPDFDWPFAVRQVLVSCTGRLQPEHVLKAFETGSDAVCLMACREDDCHFLEGSKRCARRAAYLRSILVEIGLGGERLMLFHLPGTAAEDMALGIGRAVEALAPGALEAQVAAIRERVIETLRALPPSPLRETPEAESDEDRYREVEVGNDDNEE